MTNRETIRAADKLIEQGFQALLADGITIEIATSRFIGPNEERAAGDYPDSPYDNGSWVKLGTLAAPVAQPTSEPPRDTLLPSLAGQGAPGSAERIEALRRAYEWREALDDDSSPFTVSNEQIASFAAEYFTRNARYSKQTVTLASEEHDSEE